MKSPQQQVTTIDSHRAQAHQSGTRGLSRPAAPNGISLPVQRQPNRTGLPDQLKAGVENLSGHSLDDVRVHYNSDKPATLQAHAYAQGTDIHLAPGQEKHLPHEAWHVVQQKQGRVKPTLQLKGGVAVNDDDGLEKEADVMGAKSISSTVKEIYQKKEGKAEDVIMQRVFSPNTYRLSSGSGATRNIHVEGGSFVSPNQIHANLSRAVLHETMVRANNGLALAVRYNNATTNFRNAIGLTVSINTSYTQDNQLPNAKRELKLIADEMEAVSQAPINVVKVLWQDKSEHSRTEVPFAELRKHASTDEGSKNLYAYLSTQATTVWRKMGDDDMPFINPNDATLEVNQELENVESNNMDGYLPKLITFSYALKPETPNQVIQQICTEVYKAESRTIAEVREKFHISVYANEPTTYYRSNGQTDASKAWVDYENNSDDNSKQIKEGASFAKSFRKLYGAKPQYVQLIDPIPTADGGRLNTVVRLLERHLNAPPSEGGEIIAELETALRDVDQSVWKKESLTQGAKWMASEEEKSNIYLNTPDINAIIERNFKQLLVSIFMQWLQLQRQRQRIQRQQAELAN